MSKIQFVSIDQPMGADLANPFCPICGKRALPDINDKNKEDYKHCKHLSFIYVHEVSEFEYITKELNDNINALEEQCETDEDYDEFSNLTIEELINKAGGDDRLLVLEITSNGMACGPYSSTATFRFDYNKM